MVGIPAKQIGWVSKAGNTLALNERHEAVDNFDNSKYAIIDNQLKEIE